jgi:glycosyltransferase involved in cell wall biosynthesis
MPAGTTPGSDAGAVARPSVPLVSVVIATYNSARTLRACLESLSRQSWPRDRYEVLVIDDGSTDDTADVTASFPWVRTCGQPNAGPSAARNRGISQARGRFVAFTDSDCVAAADWLESLHEPFSDPSVLAVGGGQRCPEDATPFMSDVHGVLAMMGFLGGYTKAAKGLIETGHNPACNAMYRRDALERAGGFRIGMFPGEDVDLDHRIRRLHPGGRILYTPRAQVFHYRPPHLGAWWRMMVRYGFSSGHNVRLHGLFRPIHLAPLALALLACLWIALAWIAPLVAVLVLSSVLAVGTLLVGLGSPGVPVCRVLLRAWMVVLMLVAFSAGFFRALWRVRPGPEHPRSSPAAPQA